jgi:hypothetical protein
MSLRVPHDAFAAALLDPDRPAPDSIVAPDASERTRRFAVYRNNVVTGLIDALRTRFPATERVAGEEFFLAMAQVYVRAEPPRSPLMFQYGDSLPDFIAGFEPAADMPYLADLARLEAARTRAYHAADACPLAPQALADLADTNLLAARLSLHPSITVIASRYPVAAIWAMNTDLQPIAEITDWRGDDVVIARPAMDVEVRRFPTGTADFVDALRHVPLGEAAAQTVCGHPDIDLTATFATLLAAGVFIAFDLERRTP